MGCEGRVGGCGAGALEKKSAALKMCVLVALVLALPVPRIRDGGSGLHTHRTSADGGTWRPRRGSNGRRAGGAGGAGAQSWRFWGCTPWVHQRLCPSLCTPHTCAAQVPFMPHRPLPLPPPHTHTTRHTPPRATHHHAPHTTMRHTPRTTHHAPHVNGSMHTTGTPPGVGFSARQHPHLH